MKLLLSLAVITCVALATSSSAFAKAKKPTTTLADFKGSYRGTVTISVAGLSYVGSVALGFATNKTGKSGSITINGSLSSGGTTLPVIAVMTLNRGSLTIDNFVFNTITQGAYPGFGSYTVKNKTIQFQGSATVTSITYPFSGSVVTKTKGRKQTLTATDVVSVAGTPYTFTFTVSRHLKKSEIAK